MKFFWQLFYNAGILFYRLGISVSSLRNKKARLWVEGRKNLFAEIADRIKPGEHRVWFHCASVGEFEQARPVIEAYQSEFPNHKIVLTFFSPSGYELRKNYPGADYVFCLPLDTSSNAKHFIQLIEPKLAIFVKYEFWFHFLKELQKRKIPTVLISVIIRKNHFLFSVFARPLKSILKQADKIFVQDESSLLHLTEHGFKNAKVAGDTRFDRVWQIAQSPKSIPVIENFKGSSRLFVGGSTWPPDEKLILQLLKESNEEWKWILVPHEIDAAHIAQLKKNSGALLYSEAENGYSLSDSKVLIIDKIGFLSSIYRYADIVYVGGGFGSGIHNTLEAAVYGIPVLFGPNYEKFNEANGLVATGGGKSVKNYFELKEAFLFYQKEENKSPGESNREWAESEKGATDKIMTYLRSISGTSASPA